MRHEIPDGLAQLRNLLRQKFTNIVPEAKVRGSDEERERNFLSRALAAYAVHKLSGCSLEQAAAAVVDGGGDGGIDAIYYARQTTDTLWVIQSKFIAKGTGEPDGLRKFCHGLEALLEGKLDYFEGNEYWRNQTPILTTLINASSPLQIKAVIVYSSIHSINPDKLIPFENLRRRYSPNSDYFTHSSYNLSSLVDWMIDADQTSGVPEVHLTIHCPGKLDSPYETVYGIIKLADMKALYHEHGKRMIVANIRGYQGDTEVNNDIFATLCQEPDAFVYLNNGLTAYCERLDITHADKGRIEYKRITAKGFSIINGAQTLGAIGRLLTELPDHEPDGYVFLKLISLERCDHDIEFAQRITRTANYQNRIDLHHFIAQQPYQQEIAQKLRLSGINYHFKDDMDTPPSDEYNFTLKDATTALACLEQMGDCDFVARVLANRKSLWSLDVVDADNPLYPSRYARVFRADRSARSVWRAVQTQTIVIEKMKENTRAETGVRKAFFENARWLVLNIIFLHLRPEQGNEMALTPEEAEKISVAAIEIAEKLWVACETLGYISRRTDGLGYEVMRHLKSVFSTAADCARLRNAILADIAK